ncbi:hypothetical protein FB451DRAFT_1558730 [Mycena latifolia]|nr:hypothetical protein FB451DRAFT_1558730 [Mycena latifolia]
MSSFSSSTDSDCGARFSRQERMACLAGYRDVPCLLTALSFDLLQIPHVTSCIVSLPERVLELWSPNSLQSPFLPGLTREDYSPGTVPTLAKHCRYDRHVGRHDCLYAPQYFRADNSHWPFIRRAQEVPYYDSAYVAYAAITLYWRRAHPTIAGPKGYLDPEFVARLGTLRRELELRIEPLRDALGLLWDSRPRWIDAGSIAQLLAVRLWDEAVDQGVAVQRGLRELEAWAAWAEEHLRQVRLTLEELRSVDMPLARENFIGVWINSADERTALSYMLAGIPCFIVHAYSDGAPTHDVIANVRVFRDFLSGMEVEALLGEDNAYEKIARLDKFRLDAVAGGDDGRASIAPPPSRDDYRSSSLYLEALPRPSLVSAASVGYDPSAIVPLPNPARAPPEAAPDSSTMPVDPASLPLAVPDYDSLPVPSASDRYAAPPLTRLTVDPSRVDWVVPPPIATKWTQKWSKWELDEWCGQKAWVGRGRSITIEADSVWFDCKLGRQLFFRKFLPPPGILDFECFGAPVPRYPFYYNDGKNGEAPRWEEMKKAERPAAERLPLLHAPRPKPVESSSDSSSDDSDEEPGPGGRAGRDKGKGRAKSASLEQSDEEEARGMDIDYEEEEKVSPVVVLDGVDAMHNSKNPCSVVYN